MTSTGRCGSDFAGGFKGLAGFVERGHGLDDEQVDARPLGEDANLLGKGGAGFVEAGLAQRLEAHAERADGAGDPGLAGLLFFEVGDGLAGKAHAGGVDLGDFAGQAVAGQAEAIGAEGVGFEDLRAGLQVLFVDGEDQRGVGEVQLVVAAVDEDAARVEDGAHGAIGEHGAVGEDLGELGHSVAMLSHGGSRAKAISLVSLPGSRSGLPARRGSGKLRGASSD